MCRQFTDSIRPVLGIANNKSNRKMRLAMINGHQVTQSQGNSSVNLDGRKTARFSTVLARVALKSTPIEGGDVYHFDGGSITLRPRDAFEVFYVTEKSDYIAFTLDSTAEMTVALGPEDPKERTVLPGTCHFHPAGRVVYGKYTGRSMQVVSIAIDADLRREVAGAMGISEDRVETRINLQTSMTDALSLRLRDFMANGKPGGEVVARSLAVLAVHDALAAMTDVPFQSGAAAHGLEATPLRRVLDFIEANIEREITLNEIAEIACKSPFHFARTFKAAVGTTPVAYVIERRIERSKELLLRTDLPVSGIANRCGFNSQSHFCRTFRRLTGHSPREFRRQIAA